MRAELHSIGLLLTRCAQILKFWFGCLALQTCEQGETYELSTHECELVKLWTITFRFIVVVLYQIV